MNYELPTTVEVCGAVYPIRSDYRAILDICAALDDPELEDGDKAYVALSIFYPDFEEMPPEHYTEALRRCYWFIDCGEDPDQTVAQPKLMDWSQDFKYIIAPINRVMGKEVRSIEYLHWWTFISAYYEIGDCFFAQCVRIRDLKAHGKKLDKADAEFYKKNRKIIDIKTTYTERENEILAQWLR